MQDGRTHTIKNNSMITNFCRQGCGFSIVGDRAMQLHFEQNFYGLNLAATKGAVFDSSRYLTTEHVYIVFKNETV
jgi:hypothetical protein